ncbi:hypothetical protein DICPUDRAFT_75630 [Dictyostelium purpureum]|uniref:SET domain-containing protein n=1 Tax=Dictyostelium purpureum TaxID=5786 RepID=F0ZB77_DICPU|nr:uncharacterized protein DICPUDRAFT_75630 [Dictyostelium purpureum]EGC38772.1 hypothetical protein DICPUDRAFT_75630 [Dictyostelium purpureum]|eukprot:XP_003284666.1 hypothetical protein DICPUDRAFT_75630 [Dictyostelium purpureum]
MNLNFQIPGVVSRRYISEIKGRGLFAEKTFEKGDVVFSERPLFSVQHVYNRATAWTCGNCFRFLGSLNKQMLHYRKVFGIREQSELPEFDFPPYTFQTKVFSCFAKCGEKYCSEECRNEAFYNHHQVLCVGEQTPENNPMYLFKKHSIDTNELFLLAAQAIAYLICKVGNDQPMVENSNTTTSSNTTTTTTTTSSSSTNESQQNIPLAERICKEFFQEYQHRDWWDVRIDDNFTNEEARKWSQESLELLRKALLPLLQNNPRTNNAVFINTILSMEFYSHLLGLLEMNDNSIGFFNPLETFRRNLDTIPNIPQNHKDHIKSIMHSTVEEFRKYLGYQEEECDEEGCDHDHSGHMMDGSGHESHGHHHDHGDSAMDENEEEEVEEVFPSFDGYGIFGLQAMVNHSCEPNINVAFSNSDNRAHIMALRRIEAGEELYHSYIDEELPYDIRQEDLVTYGFKCECRKCKARE